MAGAIDRRVLVVTRRADRGAKLIFDLSRELYSRLATLAGHVEKLGRSLESTVKSCNGFVGLMERQVRSTARKLNKLDESTVLVPPAAMELIARTQRDGTRRQTRSSARGGRRYRRIHDSVGLGSGIAGCCELRFV